MKKINKSPFSFDLVPLYDIADEIINIYKNEIYFNAEAVATGDLLNSIDFEIVQKDDNTLTLQLIVLDYYYFIEFGRKPTEKLKDKWDNPVEDISRWLTKKIERGKFIPKNNREVPSTQKEIRKVSYAIVQKIHDFGFYNYNSEGKKPLEKALQKSIADGLINKFTTALAEQYQNDILVDITGLSDKLKKRPK